MDKGVDCSQSDSRKEVQPLDDIMGTAPSTLPMELTAIPAHHQSAGDEKDAEIEWLRERLREQVAELAAKDAEIEQRRERIKEQRKKIARVMFCRDLKVTPLQSLEDLMQRIEALELPPMDDVSSAEEPVDIKAAAASSMSASVRNDKRLDMSNFSYLWLTKEQTLQSPYLQMEIVDSALDDVLASHFFDSDPMQYTTFVASHGFILQRLRAVLWYYLHDMGIYGMLEEREHMTPIACVFVKSLIDQLPECRLNLTARVAIPGDFLLSADYAADDDNLIVASDKLTDKLMFQTKMFDKTTGSDGEHLINGDTDLVITDASDHSSFRAIIELKLQGKVLQPSAVQTRARGQVFAEMLGLKCRHPQRPLHLPESSPVFISQTRAPLPADLYVKYLLFALYCVDTKSFPPETLVRPQLSSPAVSVADTGGNEGPTGAGAANAGGGSSVGHPGKGSSDSHEDDAGDHQEPSPVMSSSSPYACLSALPVVPFYGPCPNEIRFDIDPEEEYEAMVEDALYFRRFNATIHGELAYLSGDALKLHQARFEQV
eukprot:gene4764-3419_t